VHVVVFLNGLGGSTHDTRLMRSYLKLLHPHLYCYVTTSNQTRDTEGNLVEAGERVAQELFTLLNGRLGDEGHELHKLSFVGFSLGGIVARLALRHPLLKPFLPFCHAFVTVATPHMGLLYSQSSLVSAGIFVFRSWKNSVSLAQLSLSDESAAGPDGIRNCLLYLLACGWERSAKRRAASEAAITPLEAAEVAEAHATTASTFERVGADIAHAALHAVEGDPMLEGLEGSREEGDTSPDAPLTGRTETIQHSMMMWPEGRRSPRHGPRAGSVVPLEHGRRLSAASASAGSVASGPRPAPPALASAAASVGAGVAATPPAAAVSSTLALLRKYAFSCEPQGALLRNFRHVVLLGSEQDAYAPAASCAAHWCDAALKDPVHGSAYGEMVRDFWAGVPVERITRWDVDFRNLSSLLAGRVTLDSVLGREAHIAFLETQQVSLALALRLSHVWDTSLFRPSSA
jgi:hypothetical protein